MILKDEKKKSLLVDGSSSKVPSLSLARADQNRAHSLTVKVVAEGRAEEPIGGRRRGKKSRGREKGVVVVGQSPRRRSISSAERVVAQKGDRKGHFRGLGVRCQQAQSSQELLAHGRRRRRAHGVRMRKRDGRKRERA
jgi:hypothetical protein